MNVHYSHTEALQHLKRWGLNTWPILEARVCMLKVKSELDYEKLYSEVNSECVINVYIQFETLTLNQE